MDNHYRLSATLMVFVALLFIGHFAAFAQQPAPQPTPVAVKIDPNIFDAYTGQYEDKANLGDIVFSFFREGDRFYLRVTNQDKIEIFPASEIKFFLKVTPAEAEFVRDVGGRVSGMIWRQGGQQFTTKRTADVP